MTEHDVELCGRLAPYAEGFSRELQRLGFRDMPAQVHQRVFGELGRWLDATAVSLGELTSERLEEFLADRRGRGAKHLVTWRGLGPMVGYLRSVGVVPAAARPAPRDGAQALVARYYDYLVGQRCVVEVVAAAYAKEAAGFLASVAAGGPADVARVTTAEVSAFMAEAARRRSRGSLANLVPALRSFLRFVYLAAIADRDLSVAVPSLGRRRDRRLPKVLSPGEVGRLIASCDQNRSIGRRDRAMLVVLSRLGLRAGEVAALGLDDIDWRAGQLVVHGKGARVEVLPLPAEVGETIAEYVQYGRPPTSSRAVFVRAVAPRVALSPAGVSWVVYAACDRVGMTRVSAHCLRHSAASHMLAAGSSLVEIGQVLLHRQAATTAIYAKVDRRTLVELARPWPRAQS